MKKCCVYLLFWSVLSACSSLQRPDLVRLYEISDKTYQQNPVILIHGAFASVLSHKETGGEYWPGNVFNILFNHYSKLKLSIDPDSLQPLPSDYVPTKITDKVIGRDFYGRIIKTLETAGRYQAGVIGEPANSHDRRYYVFTYDWRTDNVKSAQALDKLIEQIRSDYGNPSLKVDLVGHSMGGMIARYYLRYGTVDVLDSNDFPVNREGLDKVDKVLLVGTPNLGSVSALQNIITGHRIGLNRIPTEVLMTFPTAYQLLPHAIRDWLVTAEGKVLNRDLFDAEFWRRMQWSIFNPKVKERIIQSYPTVEEGEAYYRLLKDYFHKYLERGRRFVWSLTVPHSEIKDKLIVFGSACELTPARILIEEVEGESMTRLWPKEIENPVPGIDYTKLMLEPGDGSVTKSSLLARDVLDPSIPRHEYSYFPMKFAIMYCADHDQLTGDLTFQDNLLYLLLSIDEK